MAGELSIKIYANPNRGKGDRKQLFVRLIYSRRKVEIALRHFVELKDWDPNRERCRQNNIVNTSLSKVEHDLLQIKQRLEYEKKNISAKRIKEIYQGKDEVDVMLLKKYAAYIDDLQNNSNLGKGTLPTYAKTFHLVASFLKSLKVTDINVKEVDLAFIEKLHRFLCAQPGAKNKYMMANTIYKHHARFRTFLLYLKKHQVISVSPYENFPMRYVESNRTFLTREELERLTNTSLGGNQSLEKVRDIFLFSVFTALRFGDAQKLKMSEIIREGGRWYFYHKEQKTQKHTKIPILPPAVEIIKKYKDSPERSIGLLLPRISNQKCNAYLKVVGEIAGITDKELTHHVARHTCATTILLENGVPVEVVQAWLNHSNIRETMIYAKLTNRVVNDAVSVEALHQNFATAPTG